jgi:hypothetical protein
MKTIVETFIIEETQELIYDNEKLDKWNNLVAQLQLTGQTKIIQKEKSPIPFMHLKTSLKNVFECLCPRKISVENYSISPIPVEVLDLISLSIKEQYFEKIEIWYDEKNPDPCCVGINYLSWYSRNNKGCLDTAFATKIEAQQHQDSMGYSNENPYPTNEICYLIAKWADVKQSFKQLKERAIERFISEQGNEYKKQIKQAQRGLDDLQTEAFDKFN